MSIKAQIKDYAIEFKKDEPKEKIDYSDPDYKVFKGDHTRKDMEESENDSGYTQQYVDSDLGNKDIGNDGVESGKSEFDSNQIPVGNADTKEITKVGDEGDQEGPDANMFEKGQYIKDIIIARTK
jgi:hypothetical protein